MPESPDLTVGRICSSTHSPLVFVPDVGATPDGTPSGTEDKRDAWKRWQREIDEKEARKKTNALTILTRLSAQRLSYAECKSILYFTLESLDHYSLLDSSSLNKNSDSDSL